MYTIIDELSMGSRYQLLQSTSIRTAPFIFVSLAYKTMSCAKVDDEIRLNRFNSTFGCSLCLANTQIEN